MSLFRRDSQQTAEKLVAKGKIEAAIKEYRERCAELQQGPSRPAIFLGLSSLNGQRHCRAHVVLSDGQPACPVVVDDEWTMLGTANLDNRSLYLNFEQMAVMDGDSSKFFTTC